MVKINSASGLENPLQEIFPKPIVADRVPLASDKRFPIGQDWVNTTTQETYKLAGFTDGVPAWVLTASGTTDLESLDGDSGSAAPSGGVITIAGGTNLTSVGSGSTITVNLNGAITLATSVSSPLYTVAAVTDMNIEAATGQDILVEMGDNAGANKVSFEDSDDAEVASIDSNGVITGLTLATSAATAGSNLTGATFAADGSDADIDLTLTPKGTGNVDISSGDLDVQAGNVSITGAGQQLQVEGGAVTDFIGQATLVAGTVTVANTNIAATDKVLVAREGVGASTALGVLDVSISAGASFTITSLQPATPAATETNDVSIVNYFIVRQL